MTGAGEGQLLVEHVSEDEAAAGLQRHMEPLIPPPAHASAHAAPYTPHPTRDTLNPRYHHRHDASENPAPQIPPQT